MSVRKLYSRIRRYVDNRHPSALKRTANRYRRNELIMIQVAGWLTKFNFRARMTRTPVELMKLLPDKFGPSNQVNVRRVHMVSGTSAQRVHMVSGTSVVKMTSETVKRWVTTYLCNFRNNNTGYLDEICHYHSLVNGRVESGYRRRSKPTVTESEKLFASSQMMFIPSFVGWLSNFPSALLSKDTVSEVAAALKTVRTRSAS